jgi:hypothetical protein
MSENPCPNIKWREQTLRDWHNADYEPIREVQQQGLNHYTEAFNSHERSVAYRHGAVFMQNTKIGKRHETTIRKANCEFFMKQKPQDFLSA